MAPHARISGERNTASTSSAYGHSAAKRPACACSVRWMTRPAPVGGGGVAACGEGVAPAEGRGESVSKKEGKLVELACV
jgi:hypothetical protein